MEAKPLLIASLLIACIALASAAYIGWQISSNIAKLSDEIGILRNTVESAYGVNLDLLWAAAQEGTVTVYSSAPLAGLEEYIDEFERRFPFIKVELFRSNSAGIHQRFVSEFAAGQDICDVYCEGAYPKETFTEDYIDTGMIMNYTPTHSDLYPEQFCIPGYAYSHQASMVVILYNTDSVTEEEAELLKTWDGLTNPVWKDRMVTTWPGAMGTAYLFWYTMFVDLEDTYGRSWAEAWAANNPTIYTATTPAVSDLIRGEFDVTNSYESICFTQWSLGAPIRWFYPEPTPSLPNLSAIAAKAPHPNAAKIYYEFLLSPEGQHLTNVLVGQSPVSIGFVDEREAATQSWFEGPTTYQSVAGYAGDSGTYIDEFNEIFDYIP